MATSCSPSARARTVTAHSLKAIGMAQIVDREKGSPGAGVAWLGTGFRLRAAHSRGGRPNRQICNSCCEPGEESKEGVVDRIRGLELAPVRGGLDHRRASVWVFRGDGLGEVRRGHRVELAAHGERGA